MGEVAPHCAWRAVCGAGAGRRGAWRTESGTPSHGERNVTNPPGMTDAERAKLEAQRDRLMKLLQGSEDADDRQDLTREWTRIDNLLNRDGRG